MLRPAALLFLAVLSVRAAAPPSDAEANAPATSSGAAETSDARSLMAAENLQGSFAAADAAVAAGGGADAYAARADAERALGRPVSQAIGDYAAASRLDSKYLEKYRGLLAERDSNARPDNSPDRRQHGLGGTSMRLIGALASTGIVLLAAGLIFIRRRKSSGGPPASF